MSSFKYFLLRIVAALTRLFPLSARTGLIKLGNPDRNSPVLLTCNYRLTVGMLKRALGRIDAYLLVANSRGVNVWCAAAGGLFTNHDVVSVLKTSGIEELVDKREVILPQLAAAGVEAGAIREKTGWKIVWGPVHAKDIPRFLGSGISKTPEMRTIGFPLPARIEMAAAWAFPISLILGLPAFFFVRGATIPAITLVWASSLIIYALFPLCSRWLGPERKKNFLGFLDFERGGLQLVAFALSMLAFYTYGASAEILGWRFFLGWGVVSLVVIVSLTLDLMGSTPTYKSGLHEDRFFKVALDEEKCKGAGFCEKVCPRGCYEVAAGRSAAIARPERCVQCGACVIQCPFDALCFRSPSGDTVLPETLRKFKLNLMGKRVVEDSPKA